tara:strand:- start:431 stop:1078 length:648 start_codon:yes stop_codon:yes gene_type:complete
MAPVITEVIAVTYGQDYELKTFINSMKAQSCDHWNLRVIHDGPNDQLMSHLQEQAYIEFGPSKDFKNVTFECTKERKNDWGHSSREYALENSIFHSDYTILTNADNYYVPCLINELEESAIKYDSPDLMYWDFVSNHAHNTNFDRLDEYGFCDSELEFSKIDMGSAAVKTSLAKKVGFESKRNEADWDYFEKCLKHIDDEDGTVLKIPKILLVHN